MTLFAELLGMGVFGYALCALRPSGRHRRSNP